MSMDDGYILRKNEEEKFVLQHFFMSDEKLPPINQASALVFDTPEQALRAYEEIETAADPFSSEYNLMVKIKEITYA
jgi:hypothetical protein